TDLTGEVEITTTTAATITTTLAVTTGIPVMDGTKETGVISLTDLPILVLSNPGVPLRVTPIQFALLVDVDTKESVVELQADMKPGASGRVFAITEGQAANTSENVDFAEITNFLNANPIRKTKRKPTEISYSTRPTTLVADETVHEERGDKMKRAATTASSLKAKQDSGDTTAQTRFERLSKQSHEPPLSKVNTLGCREDNMQLMELMDLCTKLFTRVLDLENVNDVQALEIQKLKKRFKKLEKKRKSRTSQLKRRLFKVRIESSTETSLVDQEDASNQGSINLIAVEPVTNVSEPVTTIGVYDLKDKGKGIMQELEKPVKVKGKDQIALDEEDSTQAMIEADYELAQRLQTEEQGELTIKERSKLFVELMDKRKKHFAKLRAEEIRRKPPIKDQIRNQMCTYLKNMANYKHKVLEGSGKKAKGSGKEAFSKKRTEDEFNQERSKRKKTSESSELAKEQRDKEADELLQKERQQMMTIVTVHGMNVEAIQIKEGNRHLHTGKERVSIVKRNSYIDVGCKALGGSR
nr:hypothetical protein [Tanacetum cinerariifolium]